MSRWGVARTWPWCFGCGLAVIGLVCVPRAAGQTRVEPRWLRLDIDDVAVGVEVEAQSQEWRPAGGGTFNTSDRLYLAPFLELDGDGSIYHPNLLSYDFNTENNFAWQGFRITNPTSGIDNESRGDFDYLLRGLFNVRVLQEKPYATSFYVQRGRSLRNLDFFTRTIIDTEGYGARTGWRNDVVPFSVRYDHTKQTQTGLSVPSGWQEDAVRFDASNDREYGGKTQFDWTYGEFERRNLGLAADNGDYHRGNLTDTEQWGEDDWIQLRSMLRYYQIRSSQQDNDDFTWSERLNLDHTEDLESYYLGNLALRRTGVAYNNNIDGTAGVRHQLYDSLTSGLEAQVSYSDSRALDSRTDITRFTGVWTERYRKRLSEEANMFLGYQLRVSPENRESSGAAIPVIDEPHTLTDGEVTFLNQPNVILSTISVTDGSGLILYVEGLDYQIIPQGQLTQISRIPGGRIPNGGPVLVDYVAEGQPSGGFTSVVNSLNWRLDLWKRALSFYSRLIFDNKHGGEQFVLNEYVDFVGGIESDWRWLRAAAEYENYDSNLTPFEAFRFRQGATWRPAADYSLSLDLSQTFSSFPDTDRKVDSFDFIGRVEMRPVTRLTMIFEGGYRIEKGDGVDQAVATARADLQYRIGKLTASLIYEYQNQTYFSDQYLNHFLHFKVRRYF